MAQQRDLDRIARGGAVNAATVPAGQYQVCINPPIGWASVVRTTHVLSGWICSAADIRTGPQIVTFRLTTQIAPPGQ